MYILKLGPVTFIYQVAFFITVLKSWYFASTACFCAHLVPVRLQACFSGTVGVSEKGVKSYLRNTLRLLDWNY